MHFPTWPAVPCVTGLGHPQASVPQCVVLGIALQGVSATVRPSERWAQQAQSPDRDASLTASGGGVWLPTFVSAGAVSAHGVPSRIPPGFCSWEWTCRAACCARVSALNTHFADVLFPRRVTPMYTTRRLQPSFFFSLLKRKKNSLLE